MGNLGSPLGYITKQNKKTPLILTFHSPSVTSRKQTQAKAFVLSTSCWHCKTLGEDVYALEDTRELMLFHKEMDKSFQHRPGIRQLCVREYKAPYTPHTTLSIPLEIPELTSSAYCFCLFRCDLYRSSCWLQLNWQYKALENCSRETRTEMLILFGLVAHF